MSARIATVFGASGFLGRHVVRQLAEAGYRIRAAVRRPAEAQFLRPLGDVGQIAPMQANIRDETSTAAAIDGADVVVNLVGLLFESGRQRFETIHVGGSERIARLSAAAGVRSLVQVSAIGADPEAAADYARTKGLAERAVRERFPDAVILRPSVVFGPEDDFFNRFASMARMSPFLPLVGGGETKFQPVYVQDVAAAVAHAVEDPAARGQTYELGGPTVYSFADLLRLVLRETERKRLLLPLPFAVARMQARVLQYLPRPPLTPDQVKMLEHDNIVGADAHTLEDLGVTPTSVEAVIPSYLWRFRARGQYAQARA